MARKAIVVDPQTEVISDMTGRTMTVPTSAVPAPVKITVEGVADGKAFKKVLSGLDLLPTEWEGLREFAEAEDHAEFPLIHFWELSATRATGNGSGGKSASPRLQHARAWAKSVGKEINDRGRVPAEILAEYDAAKPEGHIPAEPATETAPTS